MSGLTEAQREEIRARVRQWPPITEQQAQRIATLLAPSTTAAAHELNA